MPFISVVIPVYKAENCLHELYARLVKSLEIISSDFEIILVEDCGGDHSWDIILQLTDQDPRIKGLQLSRNFGQHHAITAGLDYCNGDWIVVMDCDLQDSPEEIPKLYQKALEGYEIVVGLRSHRKDSYFKKLTSKIFFAIFAYLTDSKVDNRIGNFGIYSRQVIESICKFSEQSRSFGLFAIWVGFRRFEIPIEHSQRFNGRSSYDFRRRFKLAIDSIVSYSNKLLSIFVQFGFLISLIALICASVLMIRYILWGIPVAGWTSLMVSIYLMCGLIIGTIGIVGIYICKIFDQVKDRPLYLIRNTTFKVNYGKDNAIDVGTHCYESLQVTDKSEQNLVRIFRKNT